MLALLSDIIGNLSMIGSAWIIARKVPQRDCFWARTLVCFAAFCLLRYGYFSAVYALASEQSFLTVMPLSYLGLLLMATLIVLVCFDCDIWIAMFCGGLGYSLQHICQRIHYILGRTILVDASDALSMGVYTLIVAACLLILWFLTKRMGTGQIVVDNKSLLVVYMLVVCSTIVLDLVVLWAHNNDIAALDVYIPVYSILISALTVVLYFGMVAGKSRELELSAIKNLLEEKQRQYNYEKAMIEQINVKCHDLKHQIAALDQAGQSKLRENIQADIEAYDRSFQTGNIALDVVLTRASYNCKDKDIRLTCVADGPCLEFMSELDVYSLFGNLLDNAIEASEKLEDQEKRIISLNVSRDGFFVNVHAENYFRDRLTFIEGFPKTTKPEVAYHGFGLKSVQMLVEKYGGSLKLRTEADRFLLDILIPI